MNILSIDIETSPNEVYSFELRNAFISPEQIITPSRMLCFAARWNDSPRVMFYSEFHHGADEMVGKAHELLSEADVLLHYNGRKFDERRMNNEFYRRDLGRPAPYRRIDLWRASTDSFDFPSSKLSWVLRESELPGKVDTGGFALWRGCLNGDPKAWGRMKRYCVQDTRVLWPLYLRMRPWIANHPSVAVDGSMVCRVCGSVNLQRRGKQVTQVSVYQRYQCQECGSWSRETHRESGAQLREAV